MSADESLISVDLANAADFSLGRTRIRPSSREVSCEGNREVLEPRVMQVLVALASQRGQVLSRDRLLTDVWGYHYTGGTRTVDVHVRRLREKIPLLATALATVKQFGYKLDDPPPAHP